MAEDMRVAASIRSRLESQADDVKQELEEAKEARQQLKATQEQLETSVLTTNITH